jgi:hypothetical protein
MQPANALPIRNGSGPQNAEFMDSPEAPRNLIATINRQLDEGRIPSLLNEALLVQSWERLSAGADVRRQDFWLLAARLAEAALLCAGHYADHGEFSAAGDLLVNPRRVNIYQKRERLPLIKPRHAGVSETLGWAELPLADRNRRLRFQTLVAIRKEALLPELLAALGKSGCLPPAYLRSVEARMSRVAATIGFLAAWGVEDGRQLRRRLNQASPQTRRFVLSQCCRFQGRRFRELGILIGRLGSRASGERPRRGTKFKEKRPGALSRRARVLNGPWEINCQPREGI